MHLETGLHPCVVRTLICFCLLITITSLWLNPQYGYQKSIINIRANLMSFEDPEAGKKTTGFRLYGAQGLLSVFSNSLHCELSLGTLWDLLFFEFQISDELSMANSGCSFFLLETRHFTFPQLTIIHAFIYFLIYLSSHISE